jgi:hypothetical protein
VPSEEKTLSRIQGELLGLLRVIEGADAAPTTQAVAAVEQVQLAVTSLLKRWDQLKSEELVTLNGQLKRANLTHISLQSGP